MTYLLKVINCFVTKTTSMSVLILEQNPCHNVCCPLVSYDLSMRCALHVFSEGELTFVTAYSTRCRSNGT